MTTFQFTLTVSALPRGFSSFVSVTFICLTHVGHHHPPHRSMGIPTYYVVIRWRACVVLPTTERRYTRACELINICDVNHSLEESFGRRRNTYKHLCMCVCV